MKKILYIFMLPALALVFSGCSKWLEVNENPNQPSTAPLNGLLGYATNGTGLNMYRAAYPVSYYTQYLSSPNPASPTDVYEETDQSSMWTNLYDVMTTIYDLDKQAQEAGAIYHQGIAKILMAINLKIVHDLWGNAPHSQGFDISTLTPSFDDSKALYAKSLSLLDEGIALLNGTGNKVTVAANMDFIHGGKNAAWILTANAIKARLLNLVSKDASYNAAAVLTAVDNAYKSNSDDAQQVVFSVRNPWNQVAVNNAALVLDGWLSDQVIDAFNGTTFGVFDPRIRLFTDTTKYGDYRGTRNGVGRKGSGINFEETYINTTGFYSSTNSPVVIASYAELKMIEAEAAFRSGNKARAYTAYLEGIRAHMNKMGVAAAARDTYLSHPSVAVGEDGLTLKRIFDEKYKITLFQYEAFNDARRFDYGWTGFELPVNAALQSPPRRLVYPSVEISRNGANVPAVGGLLERLWWDK